MKQLAHLPLLLVTEGCTDAFEQLAMLQMPVGQQYVLLVLLKGVLVKKHCKGKGRGILLQGLTALRWNAFHWSEHHTTTETSKTALHKVCPMLIIKVLPAQEDTGRANLPSSQLTTSQTKYVMLALLTSICHFFSCISASLSKSAERRCSSSSNP